MSCNYNYNYRRQCGTQTVDTYSKNTFCGTPKSYKNCVNYSLSQRCFTLFNEPLIPAGVGFAGPRTTSPAETYKSNPTTHTNKNESPHVNRRSRSQPSRPPTRRNPVDMPEGTPYVPRCRSVEPHARGPHTLKQAKLPCFDDNLYDNKSPSKKKNTPRADAGERPPKDSYPDQDYLQFSLRITEDIIRNDLYTEDEMKRVFCSHIEANRNRLSMKKMLEQIEELCKELNIKDYVFVDGCHEMQIKDKPSNPCDLAPDDLIPEKETEDIPSERPTSCNVEVCDCALNGENQGCFANEANSYLCILGQDLKGLGSCPVLMQLRVTNDNIQQAFAPQSVDITPVVPSPIAEPVTTSSCTCTLPRLSQRSSVKEPSAEMIADAIFSDNYEVDDENSNSVEEEDIEEPVPGEDVVPLPDKIRDELLQQLKDLESAVEASEIPLNLERVDEVTEPSSDETLLPPTPNIDPIDETTEPSSDDAQHPTTPNLAEHCSFPEEYIKPSRSSLNSYERKSSSKSNERASQKNGKRSGGPIKIENTDVLILQEQPSNETVLLVDDNEEKEFIMIKCPIFIPKDKLEVDFFRSLRHSAGQDESALNKPKIRKQTKKVDTGTETSPTTNMSSSLHREIEVKSEVLDEKSESQKDVAKILESTLRSLSTTAAPIPFMRKACPRLQKMKNQETACHLSEKVSAPKTEITTSKILSKPSEVKEPMVRRKRSASTDTSDLPPQIKVDSSTKPHVTLSGKAAESQTKTSQFSLKSDKSVSSTSTQSESRPKFTVKPQLNTAQPVPKESSSSDMPGFMIVTFKGPTGNEYLIYDLGEHPEDIELPEEVENTPLVGVGFIPGYAYQPQVMEKVDQLKKAKGIHIEHLTEIEQITERPTEVASVKKDSPTSIKSRTLSSALRSVERGLQFKAVKNMIPFEEAVKNYEKSLDLTPRKEVSGVMVDDVPHSNLRISSKPKQDSQIQTAPEDKATLLLGDKYDLVGFPHTSSPSFTVNSLPYPLSSFYPTISTQVDSECLLKEVVKHQNETSKQLLHAKPKKGLPDIPEEIPEIHSESSSRTSMSEDTEEDMQPNKDSKSLSNLHTRPEKPIEDDKPPVERRRVGSKPSLSYTDTVALAKRLSENDEPMLVKVGSFTGSWNNKARMSAAKSDEARSDANSEGDSDDDDEREKRERNKMLLAMAFNDPSGKRRTSEDDSIERILAKLNEVADLEESYSMAAQVAVVTKKTEQFREFGEVQEHALKEVLQEELDNGTTIPFELIPVEREPMPNPVELGSGSKPHSRNNLKMQNIISKTKLWNSDEAIIKSQREKPNSKGFNRDLLRDHPQYIDTEESLERH